LGAQATLSFQGLNGKGLQVQLLRLTNGAAKEGDTKDYLVKYKFSSLSKVLAGFSLG
jgi:hypothetical protein